ncbi:class I lanthipeptide [Taibaiella koreensis]|uniref:class I lanthipeptide n=1 Tax=Taibaiella koreensis TaxID=1268548 RepID=UPI000E59B198|nr:class I lanthipeptide [Taibaiella koreensis]
MKKKKIDLSKKLFLNKEMLVALNDLASQKVIGGTNVSCNGEPCFTPGAGSCPATNCGATNAITGCPPFVCNTAAGCQGTN